MAGAKNEEAEEEPEGSVLSLRFLYQVQLVTPSISVAELVKIHLEVQVTLHLEHLYHIHQLEAEEEVEVMDQETEPLEDPAAEEETTSEDLETGVLEIVHLYHHLKEIMVVTQNELHTMKPAVAVEELTLQERTLLLRVMEDQGEVVVTLSLEIYEPAVAVAVDTVHQLDQAAQAAEGQADNMDLQLQPHQEPDRAEVEEASTEVLQVEQQVFVK